MYICMYNVKDIIMKVITTREMVKQSKAFFDLAETERVAVKRGSKFVNLIVSDSPDKSFVDSDWIKDFLAIPSEFRCNPFDYSTSGDLFWADIRNIDKVNKAIESADKGKTVTLHPTDNIQSFLEELCTE